MDMARVIKPQPGPQEQFLSTEADICIYGGAAGGGKTYALLLEPIRHINNGRFGCVIFRKNSGQITNTGGLWDTSYQLYPFLGGKPTKTPAPKWVFPSGMKVTFAHMALESDMYSWQGSQIPLICFDELTHFSKQQFFYMLSRNRSDSGVRGYIRATTNPDADSWVAEFISWWWDPKTGYPIPERSGKLRWMLRLDDVIYWEDSPEQLVEKYGCDQEDPKSVTFIPSSITDNKVLLANDPGYMASLKALPLVERERLLGGNWKIRPAAGLYFKRADANLIEELPKNIVKWVRAWDLAATEDRENVKGSDGPAYTAGVLIGKTKDGKYVIADVVNKRLSANDVRKTVKNTAIVDKIKYKRVRIRMSQDPGQAGKEQKEQYIKMLSGFNVHFEKESGDKVTRAEPFSAQWEAGNVSVLLAPWTEEYLGQLESFPDSKFKDMVDSSANGFNEIEISNTHYAPPKSAAAADYSSGWRK